MLTARRMSVAALALLPLGFVGSLAFPLLALLLAVSAAARRLEWRAVMWTAPLAVVLLVASGLSPDPAQAVPRASYMALLLLLGLPAVRSLRGDVRTLMAAAVIGGDGLALSAVVDFARGWHTLPSGLFLAPGLHDWVGAVVALLFPLALHLAACPGRHRWLGAASAVLLVAGDVFALSWTGMLGIIVGGLAWLVLERGWRPMLMALLAVAALGGGVVGVAHLSHADVRGYTFHRLAQTVAGRFVVMDEGIRYGLARPLLGWGELSPAEANRFLPSSVSFKVAGIDWKFLDFFVDAFFHGGLFGLAATLWMLFGLLRPRGPVAAASRAALVGYLGAQLFDYAFSQSTVVALVFFGGSLDVLAMRSDGGSYVHQGRELPT